MLGQLVTVLRRLEIATRPVHRDLEAALRRRWEELPAHVRTPSQALGRRTSGCEGTHGVFPRCNLACTPCYHAREANRVRTDGAHTIAEVERQMAPLRARRGPGQHAQLIGGEVTLLPPDDHAGALLAMQKHQRKPMSLTHGDFDYDYLERLVLGQDGRPRLRHLAFAGHFDSMMFGRRGLPRARSEKELNPHRQRFCEMFRRLEREHGVTHYLAHNMTVTPRNFKEVAEVVRDCWEMGFRMFSFQPAAHVGNQARWKDDYRQLSGAALWAEVERGAGARLPTGVFQSGDVRCNRTAHGLRVGPRWVPLLDDQTPRDLVARDLYYEAIGGLDFDVPAPLLVAKLARVVARRPRVVPLALAWGARLLRRAGLRELRRHGARPLTFVMHSFMHEADVRPAWEMLRRGEVADDPILRATQERLQACSYAMAHPELDLLVPACVQHAVYDPEENRRLQALLPLAASR
jgi:hypothetical protein